MQSGQEVGRRLYIRGDFLQPKVMTPSPVQQPSPQPHAARLSYVVMTYARSGGTFFAQLVGSTACLGRPEDWFNGTGYRNRGLSDYPLDRPGQLDMVRSRGTSGNGITGLKLSPMRIDDLEGFDWFGALQPKLFVHLVRRDRLGRAISDIIAQQTKQYRSTSPVQGQPRYDRKLILNSLTQQAIDEGRAQLYFAMHGIEPLEITYEELCEDPEAMVQRLADALGVAGPAQFRHDLVELKIQRGEVNQAWRDRFLAESGGPELIENSAVTWWDRFRRRMAFLRLGKL